MDWGSGLVADGCGALRVLSYGGEEPKMSSRELSSTAGLSWVDIVVAGEGGVEWADDESVWAVIAQVVWVLTSVMACDCRGVVG